jgi:preprotein translocase subunit SecE
MYIDVLCIGYAEHWWALPVRLAATGSSSDECLRAMANPFQFLQEVRSEANKVTWPTRRETLITTILVIVMVLFASFFFLAVDQSLRLMIKLILSLGHSS